MAEMCGAIYRQPLKDMGVRCTYIAGHPSEHHSWRALELQDAAEAEGYGASSGVGHDDATPNDVRVMLDNITSGQADPYLEAILAVTHNRKRTLRGVRGFENL